MQSSSCSGKWSLPVMLIVDQSLARVVQHSPFQFYALPPLELSLRLMVQCRRMRMRMTTITLRVQNLTLSSLKLSPTNIYINCFLYLVYSGLAQARPELLRLLISLSISIELQKPKTTCRVVANKKQHHIIIIKPDKSPIL